MWGGQGGRLFPMCVGLLLVLLAPAQNILAETESSISKVVVEKQGEVTRIVLRGPKQPVYTAFMRSNPSRLVVELPDVGVSTEQSPIEVGDGLVDEITLG